jgi:predicted TIM-barrel fold metal-dependent hydrolase
MTEVFETNPRLFPSKLMAREEDRALFERLLGSGLPTQIGIESLLALKQAAQLAGLTDHQVERVFAENAKRLLSDRFGRTK